MERSDDCVDHLGFYVGTKLSKFLKLLSRCSSSYVVIPCSAWGVLCTFLFFFIVRRPHLSKVCRRMFRNEGGDPGHSHGRVGVHKTQSPVPRPLLC